MKDAATAMPTAMDIKDMPDPMDMPSLKGKVSEEEWALRCQLAATYRLCAMHGWTDLVFTHISARLPDEEGAERFLINPYGVMFDEMTASSLVKIDLEGNIRQDTPYNINPAGFTIHSAIHAARHDAGCVIHVHTPYGVAVSVQNGGLRRYTQFSMIVNNDLAYHDYEGIALELDERERIVNDLGDKSLLMLRNHGTLTLGPNCAIAFLRMYFLENACKTQIFAQAAGTENLHEEDQAMADTVQAQAGGAFTPGYGDNLIWPGLMRKLKRTNPGFDH
ncbi:class II aldolase/adducin family protein [Pseudosulfitobacter pseudonitzschiae]|uniref:class II aldolase/adducin family protein n=1 Tax=Pseudosulfitobacter pseudonitzschiae TaxID=1402135 RepID=UPI001CCC2294|nr:class II aldolase/adducin family protein [Pseudosulfitobacter pseudonitzschiae]MCA0134675.1 class II aldolase/adducin family protein [Pseudosulfitobacter pseudonitzschiae]MCD2325695.1 class II aldolase/adducin family protein [Pseudosulfitobacter pseudonitzschiae]MCD2350685.1 class II aldolase/adducin family protein [Pseudosulfitobacter pseudonitzschiae]MCI2215700.1 class II aldolase/adducin family protein [Pseudosulfitobacter pseudonitzschiae]UFE29084.1 class II aldolase/adducin family prot